MPLKRDYFKCLSVVKNTKKNGDPYLFVKLQNKKGIIWNTLKTSKLPIGLSSTLHLLERNNYFFDDKIKKLPLMHSLPLCVLSIMY